MKQETNNISRRDFCKMLGCSIVTMAALVFKKRKMRQPKKTVNLDSGKQKAQVDK